MAAIRCRAEIVPHCYGLVGRDEATVYDSNNQREDGTWLENTDTVVCDPCYMALGVPPRAQLEQAIRQAKAALGREV